MATVLHHPLRCTQNPELTKSSAERSVFSALGYECTANESEPAELARVVDHFRVRHIMRSVDALRSVRLKQLYRLQLQQRPVSSLSRILAILAPHAIHDTPLNSTLRRRTSCLR